MKATINLNMTVQQSDTNLALCQLIAQRIAETPQRRITFAEYMDLVLYEPKHGYYATNTVNIGPAGDFYTSPHLGKDFGELLAEQFLDIWQAMDRPVPFTLVEMGAGQGMIAADVLQYLRSRSVSAAESPYFDFFQALEYIIVEKAEALIAEQQQRLQDFVQTWGRLQWLALEEIPPGSITGCFFSNELIDAFPVHQFVIQEGQLQEIYVTTRESSSASLNFEEVLGEPSTPHLEAYFSLLGIDLLENIYPDGFRSEINLAALAWLDAVAKRLQRGYLLTVDYGYTASQYYHPTRRNGTLQCYYRHAANHDPYFHIGQQDITAHVNFTALERQGALCGLEKVSFTQQGPFLMALGLGDRLSANNTGTDASSLSEIIRRREALHLLINPISLGGFGVLIQSKGLTPAEQGYRLKGLQFG
jgi:SAM-dependent MidA family methyltransferase